MNTILLQSVNKSYRHALRRKTVLQELTLSIKTGEVFGFLGPNGAGKSTAIKLLLNFLRPDSGRMFILGKNIQKELFQMHVGYLPETPCFYEQLTGQEMLNFAGTASGIEKKTIKIQIESVFDRLKLLHAANHKICTYSKGMKQRLGLACAIIHEPEVLILDEPMSGLDPLGRKLVADVLLDMHKRKKTIFFSSHILSDVEHLCDRIGVLNKGKLLFCDTIDKLKSTSIIQNASIESAFVSIIEQDNKKHSDTN